MLTCCLGTETDMTLLLWTSLTVFLVVVLGETRLRSSFDDLFENCLLATSVYPGLSLMFPRQEAGQSTLRTFGLFRGFLQCIMIMLFGMTPLFRTTLMVLLRSLVIPVGLENIYRLLGMFVAPMTVLLGVTPFPRMLSLLLVAHVRVID